MKSDPGSPEQRQILATARRYRRDGYKVSMPRRGDPLPLFLEGLVPDLVAERDNDRVIVEVKRTDAVPGSNDIVALAEKIAPHSDWRFELIAVPTTTVIATPKTAAVLDDVDRLAELGFTKAAFLVSYTMIENIISYAAARNNVNPADHSVKALAHELAVLGEISRESRDMIAKASDTRNEIAHGLDPVGPNRDEVEKLARFGESLMHEIREQEVA